MKKIAILAAAVFCCSLTPAQEAAPAPAAAVSQEELDAVIKELVDSMSDITAIFESVTDKETADAAAVKLMEYKSRIMGSQARFEDISSRLTEEQQMLIMRQVFPLIMTLGPRMEAAEKRVSENDFYGSEALKAVFAQEEV